MQQVMRTLLIVALARGALSGDSADGNFGPSSCISVSRSAAGSCVITTDCQGLDTSDVEFGISCVSDGRTQWHSYGKGGFEANEQFDTGLQCDDCNAPNIDPINGEVTDDKIDSMGAEMIHIEPTTPGPWMVAPTFEPGAQKPNGGEQSLAAPANPPPRGLVETHKKVTDVDPVRRGDNQSKKPKITSADGVNLGPRSLIGTSNQQKVEDGYVVAEIANFADTASSADPSIDSADSSDLDDESEAPAQRQQFLRPRQSHIQQNTNLQTFAPEVERFGPRNCISTWRNAQGHCMLQTQCSDSDLLNVDVGLICVGADGDETRHLFGKDSFDDNEEFDTQITCSKCTANRHAKNNQALSEKLQVLSEGIEELETGMKSIGENVQRLNAKVFPTAALTQTRAKPIHRVHKKPIHRVQNLRAALLHSGKGVYDEDTEVNSAGDDSEDTEAQEEQEAKRREQEAHEREVEDRKKEEKRRACDQGNEFNFDGDC